MLQILPIFAFAAVLMLLKRYFIMTSGPKKTNLPFISNFNLITGSKDIVFTNNKVLAVNAHDRHQELGDTFGCYYAGNIQVFSRDPDLIRKICVKEFHLHPNRSTVESMSPLFKASLLEVRDQEWHSMRKVIASVLTASKLKQDNVQTEIDNTITNLIGSIHRRLKRLSVEGDESILDVHQLNKNFFAQSSSKILYAANDLVDFNRDYNEFAEELWKFINCCFGTIGRWCYLLPILSDFMRPLLKFFDYGKYLHLLTLKIDKIMRKVVTSKSNTIRGTTIHSMIETFQKGELTKDQLVGNALFMMLASVATSVDTMSAFMWELAQNQDVQERLRDDLMKSGESSKYLEQCINETLRLYPGAITSRDITEDVYHKNFRIVKGSVFNINLYSLHRDAKFWGPDAEVWRPERFEPSEVKKHHPAQFIPFNVGPRICVGYNLARLSLTKLATSFLLQYKLEPCKMTQNKIEMAPLGAMPLQLPLKSPFYLKVTPVQDFPSAGLAA